MATETKLATGQTPPATPHINSSAQQVALMPVVTDLIGKVTRPRPGQPTKRSEDVVTEVLDRIASGETLIRVCSDAHLPGYSTFRRWCQEDPELLRQVDEAYEWHARVLDDIVDDMLAGGPTSTGDFRRDEARAGHMRWRMGKINRKRFGDKVQMDVVQHQPVILDWNAITGPGGDGV